MNSRVDRFCIFCGKQNQLSSGQGEHVIPKWLIKSTGAKNRTWEFLAKNEKVKISLSKFTIPACNSCNHKWGQLEEKIKPVANKIENREDVGVVELIEMMDWINKTRLCK